MSTKEHKFRLMTHIKNSICLTNAEDLQLPFNFKVSYIEGGPTFCRIAIRNQSDHLVAQYEVRVTEKLA